MPSFVGAVAGDCRGGVHGCDSTVTSFIRLPKGFVRRPARSIEAVDHVNHVILYSLETTYRLLELASCLAVQEGHVEDLRKARWYIEREIAKRVGVTPPSEPHGY